MANKTDRFILEHQAQRLQDEIEQAYNAIFPAVPEARDASGKQLTLADKIHLLRQQYQRLEKAWQVMQHTVRHYYDQHPTASEIRRVTSVFLHQMELLDPIKSSSGKPLAPLPNNEDVILPAQDANGFYRYPDGAVIYPALSGRTTRWNAHRANGVVLRGDNDEVSYFDSPQEAARCLAQSGEGPAAMPKTEEVAPPPKPASYEVLCASDVVTLARGVDERLLRGWQCLGGVAFDGATSTVMQAVLKPGA